MSPPIEVTSPSADAPTPRQDVHSESQTNEPEDLTERDFSYNIDLDGPVAGASQPAFYAELWEACRQIDVDRIERIIIEHPDVDLNMPDPEEKDTPLLQLVASAAMDGATGEAVDGVRMLIAHGADVHIKASNGFSSLHHCARWDNEISLEMAEVLIEAGANVNVDQRMEIKATEAPTDGEKGHEHGEDGCECGAHIGALLETAVKSAGLQAPDSEKKKELDVTPLHHACGYGDNLPMVKLLIENGAKVDINDEVAGTPLLVAVQNGREEITAMLLRAPGCTACLSIRDKIGRLPLHHAAENGSQKLVAMLVESGAVVDALIQGDDARDNEKGLTPLLVACKNASKEGMLDVIQYLLDHGADALKTGGQGQTPLLLSVLAKNVDAAKLLVKHGADPKAAVGPFEDVNALHVAGTSGSAELCKWLVQEAGFAVDAKDNQGYTALINAAGYSKSPETIRMLVTTLHADIEASIYDGRRPLHFAAFKGQAACAEELLALGADKEAVDRSYWTPLHFAARYHHADVIRVLLKNGAEVGKEVSGGPRPKRVDGEEFDIDGFTAADLARIIRGGQECVDILVEAGDTLSEDTKDLKDDDLWKEEPASCCVM